MFNVPIKIPASHFDIDKQILKFMRGKRPRIYNTVLKEMNKFRGLTLYNFKNYYTTILINTCALSDLVSYIFPRM